MWHPTSRVSTGSNGLQQIRQRHQAGQAGVQCTPQGQLGVQAAGLMHEHGCKTLPKTLSMLKVHAKMGYIRCFNLFHRECDDQAVSLGCTPSSDHVHVGSMETPPGSARLSQGAHSSGEHRSERCGQKQPDPQGSAAAESPKAVGHQGANHAIQ